MNILLAVDRSRHSKAAALFLQWLRFRVDSNLFVLHVIDLPLKKQASLLLRFPWYEHVLRTERKQIKAKAEEFVGRLIKALHVGHESIHPLFRFGVPDPHIVNALRRYRIDLVVLGSRGVSGVRRFLLGSVSDWVLNEARCSVLIVRGNHPPSLGIDQPSIHILFATDGSEGAQTAMRFLDTISFPPASRITILHVFELLEESSPHLEDSIGMMENWEDFVQFPEEIKQGQEQAGMAVLTETRRHLLQPGLTVNETFSEGYVAEEVIRIAEQLRVDLVVVGSKETSGRKKFPLGRVPRHVVRHAPCSVLVVRPRENGPRQVLF